MAFHNPTRRRFPLRRVVSGARRGEEGTILLLLLLTVALMAIAAVALIPTISYEMKRDRETEMIHRGVQYTRAIKNYYKKFGRYPTKLEDLDNTNNLKYLRKHYKDPLTGKDFKLLRYGDPDVKLSMSFGGGTIPGASTVGQMNGPASGSAFGGPGGSSFGGNSSFGGSPSGNSSFGNSSFGNSSGFGGNSNSAFGSNNNGSSAGASAPGGSSSDSSSTTPPEGTGPDTPQASQQIAAGSATGASSGSQQVFGGGPIVGVASTSKEKAFHEYNKKSKYNEWQFVYDPTADRGGLITTPYQPNLPTFANINGQSGQNGQPGTGTNSSPFGQSNGSGSSGFGNGGLNNSGFGNNNSGFGGSPQPPQNQSSPSPQ